ncbi:MAG: hypothetical protein ACOYMQ_12580, partial [Pseudanabaena sp.]
FFKSLSKVGLKKTILQLELLLVKPAILIVKSIKEMIHTKPQNIVTGIASHYILEIDNFV